VIIHNHVDSKLNNEWNSTAILNNGYTPECLIKNTQLGATFAPRKRLVKAQVVKHTSLHDLALQW
jgi:hypothetical protein